MTTADPERGDSHLWDDDPTTTGDPQACQLVGPADFPLETIEAGNIQVRS